MKTPTPVTQPTKEQVRDWMEDKRRKDEPPPTPEQIRRELGWELNPDNPENLK